MERDEGRRRRGRRRWEKEVERKEKGDARSERGKKNNERKIRRRNMGGE